MTLRVKWFIFIAVACIAVDTLTRYYLFKTDEGVMHYIEGTSLIYFVAPLIFIVILSYTIYKFGWTFFYPLLLALIVGYCNDFDMIGDMQVHNPFLVTGMKGDYNLGFNFADVVITTGILAFFPWLLYHVYLGLVRAWPRSSVDRAVDF